MANLNKVLIIGNLTRDPELRYSQGGSAVCTLGLATNHTIRRKDGTTQEETCFVDVTTFGRTAENCNQYLSKGRPVLVEGRLAFDQWTSQDGQKRSKHKIVADRVQFMSSGQRDGGGGQGGYQQRSQQQDVSNYGGQQQSQSYGNFDGQNAGGPSGGSNGYDGYGARDSFGGDAAHESADGGQEHDHNVPF